MRIDRTFLEMVFVLFLRIIAMQPNQMMHQRRSVVLAAWGVRAFYGMWIALLVVDRLPAFPPVDDKDKGNASQIESQIAALRQLNQQFDVLGKRQDELMASSKRCVERMKASQRDLSQLQLAASVTSAIQQQAAEAEMIAGAALQEMLANGTGGTVNRPRPIPRPFATPRLSTGTELAAGDVARSQVAMQLTAVQIDQLSTAARAAVSRFQECINDLQQNQRELSQVQQGRVQMLDRYWVFADPTAIHSHAHNEAVMSELNQASKDNQPARLTLAAFYRRIHSYEKAIDECDALIEAQSPYAPIALALRADCYAQQGSEKKSKADLQKAIKTGKDEPYVHWIRARMASIAKNWGEAESEWRAVLKSEKHEQLVRRELALVMASRAQATKRLSNKVVEELELLDQVSGEKGWGVAMAKAFASHVAKEPDQVTKFLDQATDRGAEDQKAKTQAIRQMLESNTLWQWDYEG
ncbi:MAG: hypothetical protein U0905_18775 [Pirellulales bacterium]